MVVTVNKIHVCGRRTEKVLILFLEVTLLFRCARLELPEIANASSVFLLFRLVGDACWKQKIPLAGLAEATRWCKQTSFLREAQCHQMARLRWSHILPLLLQPSSASLTRERLRKFSATLGTAGLLVGESKRRSM